MSSITSRWVGIAVLLSAFLTQSQAAIPPSQRNALIVLFETTGGDTWSSNTHWRKSPGVFGDIGTECSWFGVRCNEDETAVERITLSQNQLQGSIPPGLVDLVELESLDLGWNLLAGSIPAGLGSFSNLWYLSLEENQLSGTIPGELGNLAALQDLRLNGNQLEGPIPAELGNLTNLIFLWLYGNQLEGPIPAELGNLVNLELLHLFNNPLAGMIPSELGNLTKLQVLGLEECLLEGPIPAELTQLTQLEHLTLQRNLLTGPIPPGLAGQSNLKTLWLYQNQLSGPIPPQLGNLANLEQLMLHSNPLMGTIPPELGNLSNLKRLGLSRNQLTGPIPPELGNLSNLEELILFDNQLSGPIPPELGNLSKLQNLYLDRNRLTGSIPPQLGSLSNLERLFLANNQLSGPIPSELGMLDHLEEASGMDLSFNHLYTDNNALREFLNSKNFYGNWERSQTLFRNFAHFGKGGGLFSQIVLFSLNDVAEATGQVEALGASGEALQVDLNGQPLENGVAEVSLPAGGLLSFRTGSEGQVQQGSLRITTNRHVEGVVIFGGNVGLAGVGSSPTFSEGFVAPIQSSQSLGINTGIAVTVLRDETAASVAGEANASLDFSLLDEAGHNVAVATSMLPPDGHEALFVTDIEWDEAVDFSDFSGTLIVTSSLPVTATAIQTRPGEFVTLPVAPLQSASQGSSTQGSADEYRLLFAQFADGAGALSSQILLLSLNEQDTANVQVLVRDSSGNPMTVDLDGEEVVGSKQLQIGAGAVTTLATDGLGGVQEGSVTVTSDQPLAGVIIFSGTNVGAAGVGSSLELPEGLVAPMETDKVGETNTGIALMNLEAEENTIAAELLDASGQPLATSQLTLPGWGHDALFVTEIQWDSLVDFSRFEGLLRLRTSGSIAATVIQVRPGQFATLPVAAKPAS